MRENAFEHKKKKSRIKFNPRLSANRPSNNWNQAPVVQTLDSAIHWINHYPVGSVIGFPNTYPLDGDLSGG